MASVPEKLPRAGSECSRGGAPEDVSAFQPNPRARNGLARLTMQRPIIGDPKVRGPKIQGLKKRPEFLHVAGGSRWVGEAFVLQARARRTGLEAPARTGFTASRKVGNAVARNRARRRLKEAARMVLADAGQIGHDYVLVARRGALCHPFSEILSDLGKAVQKVHNKLLSGEGRAPGRQARGDTRRTHNQATSEAKRRT